MSELYECECGCTRFIIDIDDNYWCRECKKHNDPFKDCYISWWKMLVPRFIDKWLEQKKKYFGWRSFE